MPFEKGHPNLNLSKKPAVVPTSDAIARAMEDPAIRAQVDAEMQRLFGSGPQKQPPMPPPPVPPAPPKPEQKPLIERIFPKKEPEQPKETDLERARRLREQIDAKIAQLEKDTTFKVSEFKEVHSGELPVVDDGNGKSKRAEQQRGLSFGDKMKLNRNPLTTYLITMYYGNATCEHFVLECNSNFMTHRKKKYHLDKTQAVWDANEKSNRLFYHENFVEPLQFKTIITETGEDEAYVAVTPENLEPIIKMEFVRLIAEGPELSKMVKIVMFLCIAILGLLLIIVIIFIAQSGIFQQLGAQLQGVAGGVRG